MRHDNIEGWRLEDYSVRLFDGHIDSPVLLLSRSLVSKVPYLKCTPSIGTPYHADTAK
jgi:hypothetical protein